MQPRVIINSLPKAGTNMVAKLLDSAGMKWNRVCFDSRMILRANPATRLWRKASQFRGDEVIVGIGAPVSVPRRIVDRELERLKPNQFVKAHVGYTTAIVRLAEKHKVTPVVIIRDPRDVVVSQVHYVLSAPSHMLHRAFKELGSHERCLDAAINGGFFGDVLLEDIRTRCLSLDVWLRSSRSIVVRFEDLVGERGGGTAQTQLDAVTKIIRGVGLEKSDAEIQALAENLHGPGSKTFRKGVIGESWKELTKAQLQRMETMLGDIYEQWGYDKAGAIPGMAMVSEPE
jgi:hypothetical protein